MDGTTSVLASVVTTETVSGLFNEIYAVLPVMFPVSISYMAVRKALSFVFGLLRQA